MTSAIKGGRGSQGRGGLASLANGDVIDGHPLMMQIFGYQWADSHSESPPVTLLLAPSPPESHTISRQPLRTMLPRKNIPTGLLLFIYARKKVIRTIRFCCQ